MRMLGNELRSIGCLGRTQAIPYRRASADGASTGERPRRSFATEAIAGLPAPENPKGSGAGRNRTACATAVLRIAASTFQGTSGLAGALSKPLGRAVRTIG